MRAETVNLNAGVIPDDYHCRCHYCTKTIGELRHPDGSYYSRLERREYYSPTEKGEGGHIAKTPLHVARWAIQQYSAPGDWVLDPTIGAGTTAVEALTQGRNVAGMELQYERVLTDNIELHAGENQAVIQVGDARKIGVFLAGMDRRFQLVVNNPPYFGDQSMPSPSSEGRGKEFYDKETKFLYDQTLPNLAFLKEGPEYWETMRDIYGQCAEWLVPGGHIVIGVKDQMRRRQPDQLHEKLADVLAGLDLEFVGTTFLRHHPGTLHLNSYGKRYGVEPPKYQTITVFRRSV